ncbi:CBS domain-containing protein [Pararhodobacter marinus]|uniref:CBS domain-containing protein n=1 Tax=Pararhodobacter marinus TaxID=2184063 RepID=A0A2U2C5Z8_9RHOB|nr:CBS domain-containing protein [Pararhodobacter marinus]PWE27287.1 CBS domain-containing protein [Pararhodobacter marinus]
MPASYQPPMRKDEEKNRTHSQSAETNLKTETLTVRQVLDHKGHEMFSITPDETLRRAVEILRDKRIGALLVCDTEGALVGILSERDIVRKLADMPGQTLPQKVGDVMTSKVQTCEPSETLMQVLKTMNAGRFRHMPVMEGGALAGMITIGDVVNYRLVELEHEALQLKQLIVG